MSRYQSGILQGKAYRILQDSLNEVLTSYNLSIPEWKVLGLIFDNENTNTGEISTTLFVEPPLTTRILNSLQKNSFIKKKVHKEDKRITTLVITEKGKTTIKELENKVGDGLAKLLKGVTHEQLNTYKEVMEIIVKNSGYTKLNKEYIKE